MIAVDVPGHRFLELEHLVLDYNGTLAVDGDLLPGVGDLLRELAKDLRIHVITADTFGKAAAGLAGLPVSRVITPHRDQDTAKLDYVVGLGKHAVVAIGNGRNDRRMVEAAALGIAIIQPEGASVETLLKADVACTCILDALELLQFPKRLIATLRS
jgi:soluble P-type ATPase